MTRDQFLTLTHGQTVKYAGLKIICPQTGKVLRDCPAGVATVLRAGWQLVGSYLEYFGATLVLPSGNKAYLVDADFNGQSNEFYSL